VAQSRKSSTLWRRSAIAVAVGLSVVSGASFAQSNTTGNIYGQIQTVAGASVVVENTATGFKRVLTPDASGRFVASALPTGTYKVTLMRDGKAVSTQDNIEVTIGQGREVAFAEGSVQTVQVVGKVAQIDMSSVTGGATFTAKQLSALPIKHDLNSIIQLAPNTTTADPRYSGGASMGGGAPSENAYYINGFPVTNPLSQLGSSELPFGAIQNAQVYTGGYGVEFGRSTGGVINITTKSGGNTWEAGVGASYSPNGLRASPRDIYYPNTGVNPDTDGKLYRRRSQNTLDEYSIGGYIGGPLIEDQLFMFVAAERLGQNSGQLQSSVVNDPTVWNQSKNINDRYLAKFDWNITNDHHLEFTAMGDTYRTMEDLTGYDYATGQRTGTFYSHDIYKNVPNETTGVGAQSQILKYTGYLTDDLTIQALVGQSKTPHSNYYSSAGDGSLRQTITANPSIGPGATFASPYPFAAGTTVLPDGAEDKVNAMRFDLEYRLGDHTIRGGIDSVKLTSKNAGEYLLGGGLISYYRTTNPNAAPGGGANLMSVSQGNALYDGTYYYYGRERIFNDVTNAKSNQSAQYIEDKWQITKSLAITGGLRNEQYENKNGDGETFLKMDNQLNPRLSFTWDALGDSSTKVFGSAGRYMVQIPTHLAVRGASRSTLTNRYFTYTGVDANGQPTGVTDISNVYSPDGEFGQAKDAKTVAALDLKPNAQNEFRLGIEKALSDELTVGGVVTYRRMTSTIDDFCDYRPFVKYAADNNINTDNWAGFSCASFNPGKDNTFLVDYAGDGTYTKVHLTKEELGFPSAKRTYFAVDLYAEHPMKDGWYGRVNYTFSQNKGNTEGQTLSDVAQTDVSATQTWDFHEIMDYSYGYLPGDRKHQIKAIGILELTPEFDLGANLLIASGRPKNCIGNYGGTSTDYIDYGAAFHYCSYDGGKTSVPAPRGTAGRLPWNARMDLNLTYKPDWFKNLALRVDVFNIFNRQVAQAVDEIHEVDDDPSTISPTYGRTIGYNSPRQVKFSAQYDIKF
jgi:hypothetical protein